MALLECRIQPGDPSVSKAAEWVRARAGKLDQVYDVATAILFLDRLGDAKDRPLIQRLAARLLAAQASDGSWPYGADPLHPVAEQEMLAFLRTHWPWSAEQPRPSHAITGSDAWAKLKLARIDLSNLPADELKWNHWGRGPAVHGDNSNTQFALLAVWAAHRHGVPAECPILASYRHFRKTQQEDGGWSYTVGNSKETMTCAGLLGLAFGHGAIPPAIAADKQERMQSAAIKKALSHLGPHVGASPRRECATAVARSLFPLVRGEGGDALPAEDDRRQ